MEEYQKRVGVFEDDIPYEVRMKYLIAAYRRDLRRLEELSSYAKGLEEENVLLQRRLEKAEAGVVDDPDKDATIKRLMSEIKALKTKITVTFPRRVVKMHDLRKRITHLEIYIRELQSLLMSKGIPYEQWKRRPSKLDGLDISKLDIYAVRSAKECRDLDNLEEGGTDEDADDD